MSEKDLKRGSKSVRRKYETPVILPLGELASGSGECGFGSGPFMGCRTGQSVAPSSCTGGGSPSPSNLCGTGGSVIA